MNKRQAAALKLLEVFKKSYGFDINKTSDLVYVSCLTRDILQSSGAELDYYIDNLERLNQQALMRKLSN